MQDSMVALVLPRGEQLLLQFVGILQKAQSLVGMGCDYGQGYFIARPMPETDLPQWLNGCEWDLPDKDSE